ncbi:ethylbenzene dehydrogenase-related protein [Pelagibius sp. Alg239-R121]|uniref:ethylbenzene dehydrogenase-related protein n=1 Tax=Pelagibius sp. Alg239-R121 TaxID=2993448 RepID=UPI0024A6E29B|nr:ethylbenzene dehydrogenase-related protein [Pelagibius sp. Alg239-R121]
MALSASYILFLLQARLTQRVILSETWVHSLRQGNWRQRWSAINTALYWIAFASIFFAGLTGILLYLAPGLFPYQTVTSVHQGAAWTLLAYSFVHFVAQFLMGGLHQLLKIFSPRRAYGAAAVTALFAAAGTAAAFYGLELSTAQSLKVVKTNTPPKLDGIPDDPVWEQAGRVEIMTVRGANLPGGETPVTISAAHDGSDFFALFEWRDSTRSHKHLPLVKTQAGWTVLQREFGIQDEDDYYEDKFGVMLAYSSQLAGAGTAHLGDRPLPGKPGPAGGRGLHYTTDGSIVDVWHWKSVRSGSSVMNQIDDNHFGPPLEPNPKKRRYTGGYTQDPKSAGGFKMNWESFKEGVIQPLRLPKDPGYLKRFAGVDRNPDAGDDVSLFLPLDQTVPYDEAQDIYPVGTIMPSVLVAGPFEGDRGDVQAVARWQDGWWRMEVRRKLDTGSKYDVALVAQQPVYLWVATFDHSQTRHSQHLHPVELVLE